MFQWIPQKLENFQLQMGLPLTPTDGSAPDSHDRLALCISHAP